MSTKVSYNAHQHSYQGGLLHIFNYICVEGRIAPSPSDFQTFFILMVKNMTCINMFEQLNVKETDSACKLT